MTLRLITQTAIDSNGTTVLLLPVTTRVFDAVLHRDWRTIKLIINRPKEAPGDQRREFLVGTSPMELEQGHYAHIRSLDRSDGVILHVFEKVAP